MNNVGRIVILGGLIAIVGAYANEYPHLAQTPGATRIAASFKIQVFEQNNSISRDCATSLRGPVAMAPTDPGLDDPGKVFADTLEKLIPVMNETDIYYSRKDNIDDGMKKGKELDGQLMPLFKTLFDAEDKLRQVVAERNQMLREKRLVAIEQTFGTENFGWQTLNVSLSARRAIDSVSNLAELKEVRRLAANKPDQHAMLTQLTKLEASYNSLIRIYNMTPER